MDDPRYHTARWTRRAREAKRRDGYRCAQCGRGHRGTTLFSDHITPVLDDPSDANFYHGPLQTLCKKCHDVKGAVERQVRGADPPSPNG